MKKITEDAIVKWSSDFKSLHQNTIAGDFILLEAGDDYLRSAMNLNLLVKAQWKDNPADYFLHTSKTVSCYRELGYYAGVLICQEDSPLIKEEIKEAPIFKWKISLDSAGDTWVRLYHKGIKVESRFV